MLLKIHYIWNFWDLTVQVRLHAKHFFFTFFLLMLPYKTYPILLSSAASQGNKSKNLYRSTSCAVSFPSNSLILLRTSARRLSIFTMLCRSPTLLSNSKNRFQMSLIKQNQSQLPGRARNRPVLTPILPAPNVQKTEPFRTAPWCCYPRSDGTSSRYSR